jgi:hypothetical protein
MGRTIGELSQWARHVLFGYDGANAQAAHIDSDGAVRVKGQIDAGVDIEISGSAIDVDQVTASSTGANTIITIAGGTILQLRKVTVNVDADVTGNLLLEIGSTDVGEFQNFIVGGNHVIFDAGESFVEGASGENLGLNLPAGVTAEVTAQYTTRAA